MTRVTALMAIPPRRISVLLDISHGRDAEIARFAPCLGSRVHERLFRTFDQREGQIRTFADPIAVKSDARVAARPALLKGLHGLVDAAGFDGELNHEFHDAPRSFAESFYG